MADRGYSALEADYTDDDKLKELGVGLDVAIIFAFFELDSKNVFLTISVKDLDPDVRVIALTQSDDSANKLRAAGVSKVINPYEISGRKIHDMLKRPLIAEVIENVVFGKNYLNLSELTVDKGSFLDGKMLGALELSKHYDLVLIGVVDRELGDEFIFLSSGLDHKLDHGDVLVVIGPPEELERLRQDASMVA
ncbi:MAG: TrkA family potassium uptake protein, partial [Desulfobulbaceae bacterium]|nr:TrkA family potassium uptake protein [Desulfobulbaceae bacterium]